MLTAGWKLQPKERKHRKIQSSEISGKDIPDTYMHTYIHTSRHGYIYTYIHTHLQRHCSDCESDEEEVASTQTMEVNLGKLTLFAGKESPAHER